MFITNAATPAEILAQLIMPSAVNINDEFKNLKHNRDLCTRFQNRAELILNSYSKHRTSVEDIQGFSDQGVDVLLTYSDENGAQHRVGIQIKSYDEIEKDLKRKPGEQTLINLLSSQRTDAQSKHKVEMFYIILCGDGGEKHQDFIRRVQSKFTSLEDTKVITPNQAWSFYNLEDYEIAAYCTQVLCAEDFIIRKLRDSVEHYSDEHRRLLIAWIVNKLEGKPHLTIDEIEEYAIGFDEDFYSDDTYEKVADILDTLQINGNVININGETFKLEHIRHDALKALYFDLQVRHNLSEKNAIEYLWRLTD